MIASFQRKATPLLGLGLLVQVGGTFLREISWGLTGACLAAGAALLGLGCMYYAQAKGYRREFGLLGLLSVAGVAVLIFLPDRGHEAVSEPQAELPPQTAAAFQDDEDVQQALASISAIPFSRPDAGKFTPLDSDLDIEPTDEDFKTPGPGAKPRGSAPPSVKPAQAKDVSAKKAREAVLGENQGEVVPSRLLYEKAGMLTFSCHCGKRYKVDLSRRGEMMKCRYCKKHLLVPMPQL